MPLVDETGSLSRSACAIENTKRPGLAALLELSGWCRLRHARHAPQAKRISSLIGYVIAPRINATGRLSAPQKPSTCFDRLAG